jgi:hypothetical protein
LTRPIFDLALTGGLLFALILCRGLSEERHRKTQRVDPVVMQQRTTLSGNPAHLVHQ